MQNWRQTTHDAKDILTVCLAKAIDKALIDRLGEDWFAQFAQADAKEKVNVRITKTGQQSVSDLDLQGLLKFLRYRDPLTRQILGYYGFFQGMDQYAVDAQLRQLHDLLDRLINDFRNRIEAHSRAADIDRELSGHDLNRIYGYEEAFQDMCRLARIFEKVTDSKGVSYYQRLCALTKQKKKKSLWWLLIPVILTGALTLAVAAGVILIPQLLTPSGYYDDGGPVFEKGLVTVQPIHVYYDNGDLVAVCYVLNGTDETIRNVCISQLVLQEQDKLLAAADFGILSNTEITPKSYIKWQFRFPAAAVYQPDSPLESVRASFDAG